MRPEVMNGKVDGRCRDLEREPCPHCECHGGVDECRGNAAVEYTAGLAKVVAHVNRDSRLVNFELDEAHSDEPREWQRLKRQPCSFNMLRRYVREIRRHVIHELS